MAIELSGQLSEDVLGNLLQYLSLNLATGCLQVRRSPTQTSEVYFEQGRVVHVVTGTRNAVPALALLMSWNTGSFQFKSGVVSPAKTVHLSLDSLLLEAAYNADMAALSSEYALEDAIGENTILVALPISSSMQVSIHLRTLALLRLIDGKAKLRQLAERLSLTLVDTVALATELLAQKLVEVADTPILDPKFMEEMGQIVVAIMGPLGDVVVEDAIYDLGLEAVAVPETRLLELIAEVKAQFKRDDWVREFETRIQKAMEKHRL
ncbi:MAG: DUF4388 domain-containing protein [Deinococcaceae bacterium]